MTTATDRQIRNAIRKTQDKIEFNFTDPEVVSAMVQIPYMGVHALAFGRPMRGLDARERMANFLRDLADAIENPHPSTRPN